MKFNTLIKQLFCRHKNYILKEGDESEHIYKNGSAPLVVHRVCVKCGKII